MKIKISDKIAEQIKQAIASKVWLPESQLPSEKQLGEMYGASRVSIRSALQKLSEKGWLKLRGKGSLCVLLLPRISLLKYSHFI